MSSLRVCLRTLTLNASGDLTALMGNINRLITKASAVHPGDLLLTYTDGISEAMTNDNEEWGEQAMILAAQCAASETAEDM